MSKIIYYDGGEEKLTKIFQDKNFDENSTWLKYQKNWPLLYHLSPERKNLLRWLNFGKKPITILELGAGCGAITSYFTTLKNIEKITAVEGSPQRAGLINMRCKNNNKLEVITSNIQDYDTKEKYNFVTLIGVLEYSGRYINGANPFLALIKHASKFLKPEGTIILAIENQLGHKYLAGFREDHYGSPFEGVSNYPNYNGFKTFDKDTLKRMISDAGFAFQEWFYPFPDYKLPYLILNEKSFNTKDFDWLALLNFPTNDRSSNQDIKINERELLKLLSPNTDISCFMNSFLIFASKSNIETIASPNNLAVMLKTSKSKKFQNIKYFHFNKENKIIVSQRSLLDDSKIDIPYHKGYHNLSCLIIDAWHQKKYVAVSKYLNLWFNLLKSNIKSDLNDSKFKIFFLNRLKKNIYSENTEWLPSNNLDLIQNNCLVDISTGDIKIIDLEWDINNIDIPLKLVIDRGMFYLQDKMKQLYNCKLLKNNGEWDLPDEIAKDLPPTVRKPNFDSLRYFENWFQKAVSYGDFSVQLTEEDIKRIDYFTSIITRKDTKLNRFIDDVKNVIRKIRAKTKFIFKYDKSKR